ncbi:MAG: cytochrome c/FTR1 family iron permease [Burkholderiales bacterium]
MALLFAVNAGQPALAQEPLDPSRSGQQVLHLLDYIGIEYPEFVRDGKILDAAEYQEQVEFSAQVANMLKRFPEAENSANLVAGANNLKKLIDAKADPAKVVEQARSVQKQLISTYRIRIAPAAPPELTSAARQYQQTCAQCHGESGNGRGPAAAGLEPAPTDFTDRTRQDQRSVLGLYNTITLGVDGTAMTAYGALDDKDRWGLAFYVSQFAATDPYRAAGKVAWESASGRSIATLSDLVALTPEEARAAGGTLASELAYLRNHPDALRSSAAADPLAIADERTQESARQFESGDREAAYQTSLSAYLDGFELAEARLPGDVRARVEQKMMAYRGLLKSDSSVEQVRAAAQELSEEFAAAKKLGTTDATAAGTNFLASFVILLREGLEALLIVAAIAAFLVRAGRRDALLYVHAGWIAALLAGVATWVVSSTLFEMSGAQRETTEGVTALLSAAVLLYAGYWLHSRSHADRWQTYIGGGLTGVMSSGQLWMMGLISFLAVYREAFETVLFMQVLWVPADAAGRSAVLGGLAAGGVALAVCAWMVTRFSKKLPIGLFFGLSAMFLAVMAVVFAGKGIAALQAAGSLPMNPVGFPGIPSLGVYPNVQGLVLQAVIVILIVIGYRVTRNSGRSAN